ncbi:hypothetical protein B0H13DRAFT_1911675 [Mycena leptocephala]|nr:hypothetical protein B0H13DRAFT_1911675 [Mycena leptocephala]
MYRENWDFTVEFVALSGHKNFRSRNAEARPVMLSKWGHGTTEQTSMVKKKYTVRMYTVRPPAVIRVGNVKFAPALRDPSTPTPSLDSAPSHAPPIHTNPSYFPSKRRSAGVEENGAEARVGARAKKPQLDDPGERVVRAPRSSRRINPLIACGIRPGFPSERDDEQWRGRGGAGRGGERRRRRWRERPRGSNGEQLEGDADEERGAYAASYSAALLLLPPAAPSTVTRWASDVLSVPCQESGTSAIASHSQSRGVAATTRGAKSAHGEMQPGKPRGLEKCFWTGAELSVVVW